MKIADFQKQRRLTDAEMAALLHCSEGGYSKWKNGRRVPRPASLRHIEEVTKGEVTARDFYDAPPTVPDDNQADTEEVID